MLTVYTDSAPPGYRQPIPRVDAQISGTHRTWVLDATEFRVQMGDPSGTHAAFGGWTMMARTATKTESTAKPTAEELLALLAKCTRDKEKLRAQRDRMADRLSELGENPTRFF